MTPAIQKGANHGSTSTALKLATRRDKPRSPSEGALGTARTIWIAAPTAAGLSSQRVTAKPATMMSMAIQADRYRTRDDRITLSAARRITATIPPCQRGLRDLAQRAAHVAGQPDRAALLGDRAPHPLADPPRRIGREANAAALVEAPRRLDEADAAFLEEIGRLDAAVGELPPDQRDQAQVLLHQSIAPLVGGVGRRRSHPDPGRYTARKNRSVTAWRQSRDGKFISESRTLFPTRTIARSMSKMAFLATRPMNRMIPIIAPIAMVLLVKNSARIALSNASGRDTMIVIERTSSFCSASAESSRRSGGFRGY